MLMGRRKAQSDAAWQFNQLADRIWPEHLDRSFLHKIIL